MSATGEAPGGVGETAEAAEPQQPEATAGVDAYLLEYVSSRGIAMPFYNDGSKITEEAEELREALRAHLRDPSPETLAHLQEEVADVTIVAAVAARQAGFTVEEALRHKIAKDRGRGPKEDSP